MCDYSQPTYQATSLTCGAGGVQLMFLGAQLHHTYHCIVYNDTLQRTNLGKLPKNHIFSEATPPYDILLLHIIVCSANIRYNSLSLCLCTVTNTPLYVQCSTATQEQICDSNFIRFSLDCRLCIAFINNQHASFTKAVFINNYQQQKLSSGSTEDR